MLFTLIGQDQSVPNLKYLYADNIGLVRKQDNIGLVRKKN